MNYLYKYIFWEIINFNKYEKIYIIFSWLKPIKQNKYIGKQKTIKINIFKYKVWKIKLTIQKIKILHNTIIIPEEKSKKPNNLLEVS